MKFLDLNSLPELNESTSLVNLEDFASDELVNFAKLFT